MASTDVAVRLVVLLQIAVLLFSVVLMSGSVCHGDGDNVPPIDSRTFIPGHPSHQGHDP